jgi:hypothetical protein
VFDNTTLGADENTFGSNFRLYPNPVPNGQYSIRTPGLTGEVTLEMTNLLGQSVYTRILQVRDHQVNINSSDLSHGIYMVKLTQGDQSYTSKLILN